MPSFTYESLTELEAVNKMLLAIVETPISSLNVTGDLNVSVAREILYDTSREVQSKGWYFNRDINYPLPRNMDNEIPVPSNTLSLELAQDFAYLNITQRGNRLYDRENRTFTFDKTIKVNMVSFLSWDELPQDAKQYIAILSAIRFQKRMLGAEYFDNVLTEEEARAKAHLEDADATAAGYNLKQSQDIGTYLRRF